MPSDYLQYIHQSSFWKSRRRRAMFSLQVSGPCPHPTNQWTASDQQVLPEESTNIQTMNSAILTWIFSSNLNGNKKRSMINFVKLSFFPCLVFC